jgi:hemerythrin-like domain-containing protein
VPIDRGHARQRLVDEHAEIRRRAKALGEHPDHTSAAELGELLSAHVSFEERELFPLLEAALTPTALETIDRRLRA